MPKSSRADKTLGSLGPKSCQNQTVIMAKNAPVSRCCLLKPEDMTTQKIKSRTNSTNDRFRTINLPF